jgi:hypothetical protein
MFSFLVGLSVGGVTNVYVLLKTLKFLMDCVFLNNDPTHTLNEGPSFNLYQLKLYINCDYFLWIRNC